LVMRPSRWTSARMRTSTASSLGRGITGDEVDAERDVGMIGKRDENNC